MPPIHLTLSGTGAHAAASELAARTDLIATQAAPNAPADRHEKSLDLETVVAITSIASSVTAVATFLYQWHKDWSAGKAEKQAKENKQLDKVIVEVDGKRYRMYNLSIDQIADLLTRMNRR